MATIIRTIPVSHAGRRTTAIRIEDDGIIVCRTEESGAAVDRRFDFSSYTEGTVVEIPQDPIRSVSVQKLGADARIFIDVYEYYDENLKPEEAPQEEQLWYAYNTAANMIPSDTAPQGATPSTPVYVLWKSGGTPSSPTLPWNINDEVTPLARPFTRLGSVAERRNYLKTELVNKISDLFSLLMIICGEKNETAYAQISTEINEGGDNNVTIIQDLDHPRRMQGFAFRLETLTRAISVDSNLTDERKFNLLDGEIGLDNGDVFSKMDRAVAGTIFNSSKPRSGWNFVRLGNAAATSPFAYTPPVQNTATWNATADATIEIHTGVPQAVEDNWKLWLRS